jgi:hypothetical protein
VPFFLARTDRQRRRATRAAGGRSAGEMAGLEPGRRGVRA